MSIHMYIKYSTKATFRFTALGEIAIASVSACAKPALHLPERSLPEGAVCPSR